MNPTGEEVIRVTIDPNVLKAYKKSTAGNDLVKGFCSVLGISSNDDEPQVGDTAYNSKDCQEEKDSESQVNCSKPEESETVEKKPKPVYSIENANIIEPEVVDENLNTLFSDLKISNKESNSDAPQLIERGPDRLIKNNHRQHSVYDRSSSTEIREKLRFLSGSTVLMASKDNSVDNLLSDAFSNTISVNDVSATENPSLLPQHYVIDAGHSNPHAIGSYPNYPFLSSFVESSSSNHSAGLPQTLIDSFYDDTTIVTSSSNGCVSSGYESCSSSSFSGSPPKLGFPNSNLCDEVFGEIINEEEVLDSVVELESLTSCNLVPFNVCTTNLSAQSQKEKIINYLKGGQRDQVDCTCSSESIYQETGVLSRVECIDTEKMFQVMTAASENGGKNSSMSMLKKGRSSPKMVVSKNNKCFDTKKGSNKKSLSCNNLPPIACKPSNSTEAREKLRSSLSNEVFNEAQKEVYRNWIKRKENSGDKSAEVIYVENPDDKHSEMQSNLHLAVLNSELAKILCLVECHKQMIGTTLSLNIRDKDLKTALDYAIEKKLDLVIDYLEENHAKRNIKI